MTAFVGLGANLPFEQQPPEETLGRALTALGRLPTVRLLSCSSLWKSRPVEALGPDFINAVAEVETSLSPEAMLNQLLAIEQQFGRVRPASSEGAAAARTLDLDLIWMDHQRRSLPELCLPHPRAAGRAFVLAPLAEIRPALRLTEDATCTVEELLEPLLAHDPQCVTRLDRPYARAAASH